SAGELGEDDLPGPGTNFAVEGHGLAGLEDRAGHGEAPALFELGDVEGPRRPAFAFALPRPFARTGHQEPAFSTSPESTAKARSSCVSRSASESSLAITSGLRPSPASDTPSAVRNSPTVRSRAPPFSRLITCWKTPLPK